MEFKIGDKVERIESDNGSDMLEGSIWTVQQIGSSGWLYLKEWLTTCNPHKFKLVERDTSPLDHFAAYDVSEAPTLTIDLPKGVTLLEGEFEASNGISYAVTICAK